MQINFGDGIKIGLFFEQSQHEAGRIRPFQGRKTNPSDNQSNIPHSTQSLRKENNITSSGQPMQITLVSERLDRVGSALAGRGC